MDRTIKDSINHILKSVTAVIGLFIFFIFFSCTTQKEEIDGIVFRNFRLLTLKDDQVLEDRILVLQGDSISDIIPEEEFYEKYKYHDSLVIDGKGRYIVPSFQEMHAHLQPMNINHKEYLKHYLGYGITSIRVMAGNEQLLAWKDSIQKGALLGPELKVAGPLIDGKEPLWGKMHDGPIVTDPESVDSIVRQQKAKGYDLIKLYERLSRDVYLQFLRSAKENDIRVAGHVPLTFLTKPDMDEIFTRDSPSLEHFKNFAPFVTTTEVQFVDQPEDMLYYGYTLAANPDRRKIRTLISKIKENEIWLCPTSVLWRNNADSTRISALIGSDEFQNIDSGMRNWWLSTRSYDQKDVDVKTLSMLFLQEMAKQEVKLLAGTDFPNPFLIPGASLHDEIHSIAEMGYSNLEALKSATIYPAQYWGEMDRVGYLEKGRTANFLILKKNPLDDIRNTRSIDQVIYHGQILDPEALITNLE